MLIKGDDMLMKIKRESDIKYAINKEKGIIVAYVTNTKYDACRLIEKMVEGRLFNVNYKGGTTTLIPNRFFGKTTCSTEDTFDVKFGKDLAKEKLLIKYNRSIKKAFIRFNNSCEEFSKEIMKKINKDIDAE